jgi:Ser/Thr protein kinase RdoA (MazF antagonist)
MPDGRFLALNSYENRVYQVGLEDADPVVVKFYRPARWSDDAIREEHGFALELAAHEIPVVAPLSVDERTLFTHAGFRFAVFPRRGGRWPDLDNPENLLWLGRFLGRIHLVGAARPFRDRPALDVQAFGWDARRYLLEGALVPRDLVPAYESVSNDVLQRVESGLASAGSVTNIRLHGDCHPGNVLWTDGGPHFVDLDDCRTGPSVQDLWMLISGDRAERGAQLSEIVEGYGEFRDFDSRELRLIEPLRALRMVHYAAWLARRWTDPAFPRAFPWFDNPRYWEEHILALREQMAALDELPLSI